MGTDAGPRFATPGGAGCYFGTFGPRLPLGCPYLNTAAELRDAPDVIRHELVDFSNEVEAYLEELARRAGLPSPESAALELRLIAVGSFAVMTVYGGDAAPAMKARQAAAAIIDAAR